jgi:two-component system LytT family response regulator
MKVILIDDEPLARSVIREYLSNYGTIEIVAECNDGFEGYKSITEFKPDLIFLDIQMPKINGFEMLEMIEHPPAVIFTTAFDEFAIKAFESNAVDYLLKPFSKDRFDKAMEKINVKATPGLQLTVDAAADSPLQQNRVVVKDGNKIRIIPVNQIHYLQAADDYVKIVNEKGSWLKKRTMTFFEKSLSAYLFVRIHRSYIVNTQFITRIDPYEKEGHLVLLSSGTKLPVSKSGYQILKNSLGI